MYRVDPDEEVRISRSQFYLLSRFFEIWVICWILSPCRRFAKYRISKVVLLTPKISEKLSTRREMFRNSSKCDASFGHSYLIYTCHFGNVGLMSSSISPSSISSAGGPRFVRTGVALAFILDLIGK